MELEELITLIRAAWPTRYARGRIFHIHQNAILLENGSIVHLRVMVQTLSNTERQHAYTPNETDEETI